MGTAIIQELTEPIVVQDVFVTGTIVEVEDGWVRITGWVAIPAGAGTEERRVRFRTVMLTDAARLTAFQLKTGLARGGH